MQLKAARLDPEFTEGLKILTRVIRGNPVLVAEGGGQSPDKRAEKFSDLSFAKDFGTFTQKYNNKKRLFYGYF